MSEEAQTRPPDPSASYPPPPPPAGAIGGPQVTNMPGFQHSPDVMYQMLPMMYPWVFPGAVPLQNPAEHDQGPGVYAIPCNPSMGFMPGYPPNTLIPLTYKIPTGDISGVGAEVQGQEARQQNGPQRQVVVRRFQFAFQLDLALIIKLAAVVFLFSQEGSKQRLVLLVLFASLVYLYQTGALAPFVRWLRRAGAARPPQPPPRPENRRPLIAHIDANDRQPEGNAGMDNQDNNQNQNQGNDNEEPQAVNENRQEAEGGNRFNWWGIVKEIQMFVVGFVASLLPGFQHND